MNQGQNMNEVSSVLIDQLEDHEDVDIILILLKLRYSGLGLECPAPEYENIVSQLENVLDASGMEPSEINRVLDRAYCRFADC